MKFKFIYEGICVEIPSSENRYIEKAKTYIDTKQYVLDLQRYCEIEKANILQIRINEDDNISVSYKSGDTCGGFTTFLVTIKEKNNNED